MRLWAIAIKPVIVTRCNRMATWLMLHRKGGQLPNMTRIIKPKATTMEIIDISNETVSLESNDKESYWKTLFRSTLGSSRGNNVNR